MAQLTVVLEGSLKYREGKKWKPRWCIIRKLSPAADRLHISLYKNAHSRFNNGQEKSLIPVENFYGISSGLQLDREQHVMAIVCLSNTIVLAFQNERTLSTWQTAVRSHLGEERKFGGLLLIKAPARSKLPRDTVTLFVQGNKFCLSSGSPPRVIASWLLGDICKFGIVEDKFCFQAGNQCNKLSGVFAFLSDQAEEITASLTEASEKSKPSRSRLNSTSSSRKSSRSNLCGSLKTGSLPRDLRHKNFSNSQVNADQNFITESHGHGQGLGIVRSATTSEADYKYPRSKPQRVRQVTQSTPNFQQAPKPERAFRTIEEIKPVLTDIGIHSSIFTDREILKSRRYSSGDIYLSRLRQKRQLSAARQAGGVGTAWTVQHQHDTGPGLPRTQRSQSQFDINDFYNNVQKNWNVHVPKLGRAGEWKGQSTSVNSTLTGNCTGPSQALGLESHGHGRGYTSNSSLDLSDIPQCLSSDEHLTVRGSKAKSTGSGSSVHSTRDLIDAHTLACTIGSLSDIRLSPKQGCICSSPSVSGAARRRKNWSYCEAGCKRSKSAVNIASDDISLPSAESSSLSQLNNCSIGSVESSSIMRQDGGLTTLQTPGASGQSHNSYHDTGAPYSAQCPAGTAITGLSNGHQTPDQSPCTPLQYVDLTRFDGEDTYIHCLHQGNSTSAKNSPHKNSAGTQNRMVEYQNVPVSHHKPANNKAENHTSHSSGPTSQPATEADTGTSRDSSKILSIHGSLKRPQGCGIVQAYAQWDPGMSQQPRCTAGEYVRLKDRVDNQNTNSLPPRPSRKPRGGSLENILESSDQCNDKLFRDSLNALHKQPGSDLSAVVPARLASFSKEDLMEAIAKQNIPDNRSASVTYTNAMPSPEADYQPMNLIYKQVPKPTDQPGMVREAEYIDMARNSVVDDNSVFCSVNLPVKCSSSDCWNRTSSFSTPASKSSLRRSMTIAHSAPSNAQEKDDPYLDMSQARPTLRSAATEPAYLDMSYGQRKSSFISSSAPTNDSKSPGKPILQHSRSLDNEIDEPYLDMSLVQRQSSAEYLMMNPSTAASRLNAHQDSALYANTTPLKPFDNLIKHRCSYNTPSSREDTSSLPRSVRTGDNNSTNGDKSSSEDDNASQKSSKSAKKSSKSGSKTSNFLSRIMKRNSVKLKEKSKLKQSRSSQEFTSSDAKTSSQDQRLSMQNPPVSTSSSFPRFTIGALPAESDSRSSSSSNLAVSTPSGSPNDSGLVTLSQWRLGGGSPAQRPLQIHEAGQATGVRLSGSINENIHHYVNDVANASTPPALPPKTYKNNSVPQQKGKVHQLGHNVGQSAQSKEELGYQTYSGDTYMEMALGGKRAGPNISKVSDLLPPPLPDKSRNGKKPLSTVNEHWEECSHATDSLGRSVTSMCCTDIDEDDEVFLDNVPPPILSRGEGSKSGSMLPPGDNRRRPRKNPNLIVAIPGTSSEHGRHHRSCGRPAVVTVTSADGGNGGGGGGQGGSNTECRGARPCSSCRTGGDDRQAPPTFRPGSTRSTASSSSCDSCDTHSTSYDHDCAHHVSSPAFTTMKPRFGKEYRRIDKKRLAEELNMPLPGQSSLSHSTEPSPSAVSSVFNFDLSAIKSRQSSTCSAYSVGEAASPKYPASMTGSTRHSRDPAYVNLSISRTNSPVIIENTPPPQSPGGPSNMSDHSDVLLNYAEIDLSDSCKGKKSSRPIPKKGTVNYAVIDMVATAAISQVGREHARLREDNLKKCYDSHGRLSNSSGGHGDKHSGSVTLPTPAREKRTSLGRSNSTSSRDRKM